MGLILGTLLGAKNEGAIAVFSTLQNARARRDALNAAAEFKLNERQQELFEAILVAVGAAEKERNNLAHGCYGTSAAIPDGILWLESKRFGPWNMKAMIGDPKITQDDYKELAQYIFVYRQSDIIEVYDRLRDAFTITWEFLDYIRIFPRPMSPEDDAKYHQLCKIPRVATALVQLRSGKKNNP
jgi:hypothetical protein